MMYFAISINPLRTKIQRKFGNSSSPLGLVNLKTVLVLTVLIYIILMYIFPLYLACINNNDKIKTLSQRSALPIPDHSPFFLDRLLDFDVKKYVLLITTSPICYDCISRNKLVPILDIIFPVLTSLFNNSMSNSVFPVL